MPWHDEKYFGLHFDLHANENDTVLGKGLTAAHLAEMLRIVRPDFVQCDCKGHPGYASYPTKVGVASPGVVGDMLRAWRQAASELGIPLGVHFSGIWDEQAIARHPEWGRVNSPELLKYGFPDIVKMDEHFRDKLMVCPLSDYTTTYMIPQMLELIDDYDVDGFWVDGENWAAMPCYCERCASAFWRASGLRPPEAPQEAGWDEWLAFGRKNFVEHVRMYTDAVHDRKPDCAVCSNWMYATRQPDPVDVPVDFLSGDIDWAMGVAQAEAEARFLDQQGKRWNLMLWGDTGVKPGNSRTFKPVSAMCQEAAVILSCGGGVMVYDKPERTGHLVKWHMEDIAQVADFCRAREAYCRDTESVLQVAVLHAREHYYSNNAPLFNPGEGMDGMLGALQAMLDHGFAADVLPSWDLSTRLGAYPLCVVAEQSRLPPETRDALCEYVKNGGCLIISGDEQTKAFDELLGVDGTGEPAVEGLFLPEGRGTAFAPGAWRPVELRDASELAPLLAQCGTGEQQRLYGWPAATARHLGDGIAIGVYGPVFTEYWRTRFPRLKRFIGTLLDGTPCLPALMRLDAPDCVHAVMRHRGDTTFIHMLNLGSGHAPSSRRPCAELVPDVSPVAIRLPYAHAPASVSLAPDEEPIAWSFADGVLTIELPRVRIHDVVVICATI